MTDLTAYLEDIERRICPDEEQAIWQAWLDFAAGRIPAGVAFAPPCRTPRPSQLDWPHINVNDTLDNMDLMLLAQLERCHAALTAGGGSTPITLRANYGVGIVASLFGAEPFVMPRHMDTLPNAQPLPEDALRRLAEAPAPDLNAGYGDRVFTAAERLAVICRQFPKIGRYILIEAPDCQGPMDNCELLWGSEMFYALYDEPELVHAVLDRVTGTMQRFLDKWHGLIPNTQGVASYFGRLCSGGIVIRNDSAMNLSPEVYWEFIRPYDARLLAHFGGGAVHFCGRGDHFVQQLATTPGLAAVDISQPHLNDMEKLLCALPDVGIRLYTPRDTFSLQGHAQHNVYVY